MEKIATGTNQLMYALRCLAQGEVSSMEKMAAQREVNQLSELKKGLMRKAVIKID